MGEQHPSHDPRPSQSYEPYRASARNSGASGRSFSQRIADTAGGADDSRGPYPAGSVSALGPEPSRSQRRSHSHNGSFVSADSRTWEPSMGAVLGSEPAIAGATGLSPPEGTRDRLVSDITDERMSSRQQSPRAPPTAYQEQSPDMGTNATFNTSNNDNDANELPAATTRRPPPAPFNFEDSPAPSSQPGFSPWYLRNHGRAESQTHLLSPYTPSTATSWRSPDMRPPPEYYASGGGNGGGLGNNNHYDPYNQDPYGPADIVVVTKKRWFAWRPAWVMYLFFLFGLLCAVGHHIFYSTLHGRIADRQLEMLRYGAVLAFATKAGLVAAVIVAFRQRLWLTVRSKLLSVAALDSLFAATDDITALWNLEIYRTASVAMTLASFVWLAPLVIIFTSNTLGVEVYFNTVNGSCPNVRTLNFNKESTENWRDPTIIDDLIGQSMSTWNATATSEKFTADDFDYYTSSSGTIDLTATMATFTKQTVVRPGIMEDVCGLGWNCSYTIKFTGPGYKCVELAKGVGSTVGKFGDHDPPKDFGFDFLLPKGNFSYQAQTMGGEYYQSQVSPVSPGGMPTDLQPPYPKNLGAFRTEPVIWVGYAERVDTRPVNRTMPGWDKAFIPHVFACEHYETAYTIRFSHENGKQTTNVTDRQYLAKVMDTKWLQDEVNPSPHDNDDSDSTQASPNKNHTTDGTNDPTIGYPASSYVFPQQLERYRKVAAYHSIGMLMRGFIEGTLHSGNVLNPIGVGKALQTKLLDPRQKWFPYPNLQDRLQSLYEDIVLSVLAEPRFVSVVWAANPDIITGAVSDTSPGQRDSTYPCERSRFENRYKYLRRDLWIVYGLALLLALAAIVAGTMAVLQNEGVMHDTRFSNIVAATRGPALDKLRWQSQAAAASGAAGDGGHHGRDLPRDIKNVKVGYGIVPVPGSEQDEHSHSQQYQPGPHGLDDNTRVPGRMWDAGEVRYGFGLEGDVRQLLRSDIGVVPRRRARSAQRF